jgi:hypothetical protein
MPDPRIFTVDQSSMSDMASRDILSFVITGCSNRSANCKLKSVAHLQLLVILNARAKRLKGKQGALHSRRLDVALQR